MDYAHILPIFLFSFSSNIHLLFFFILPVFLFNMPSSSFLSMLTDKQLLHHQKVNVTYNRLFLI